MYIQTDDRSSLGYELLVESIKVIRESHEYPITPKDHGTDFLMDHRHLWLRSSKQHAIMQIRNEIIRSTYEFYNDRGFIKVDPPILTGSSPEGTTELFHTKYFDEDAFLSQKWSVILEKLRLWLLVKYSHLVQRLEQKNQKHVVI